MPRRFAWASLPDQELLQLRLKDLEVTSRAPGSKSAWKSSTRSSISADFGSGRTPGSRTSGSAPTTLTGIAIPFYLAHPRLMRLERKMMIDVEGGTVPECMRILRHEAGHVMQVAHQLQRHRRWRRDVRPLLDPLPRLLSAEPRQPALRPAPPALVRPESSRRGFRRDVRGLAHAALELAPALRGMAGTEEAANMSTS